MFSPGQRLHDRFTLRERLGRGGMSEVWRATDGLLGRDVAVKVLLSPLRADPAMREAMWREARAAARVTHPGVTQVHDYGEVPLPGGETAGYLVMELVEGQSLARRLAGGPLPWREAVRVGAQVAAALAAAHKLGVVHRDIKPGNVMLTDDGVKVLDFGIAAVAGHAGDDPGELLGTPRYAAPERFEGGPSQPASDVYSLGVLLYEALAGPAAAPPASVPEAAAAAAAPPPPLIVAGLPQPVADLCRQCRSPDPGRRPSAAQVATVLAEAVGGAAPAADPTPPATTLLAAPATAPITQPADPRAGATGPPPDPPPAQPAGWRIGRAQVGQAGTGRAAAERAEAGQAETEQAETEQAETWARAGRAETLVGPGRAGPPTLVGAPLDDTPAPSRPRRRGRPVLVAGAVALLALALVVVVAALRPDDPETGAATGPSPSAAPGAGSSAAPGTGTPAPAAPAPGGVPEQVLADLERVVTELQNSGLLDPDTTEDLRDGLADLREALAEEPGRRPDEVRKEAEDLREDIEELRRDGLVGAVAAERLTDLLSPLLAG